MFKGFLFLLPLILIPLSSALVEVNPQILLDNLMTGQSNFRGPSFFMKSDAFLLKVNLSKYTDCDTIRLLDRHGDIIAESETIFGEAYFDNIFLSKDERYFLVAGQTNFPHYCSMEFKEGFVDYDTDYVRFLGSRNGYLNEDSNFIAIHSLSLEIINGPLDLVLYNESSEEVSFEAYVIGDYVDVEFPDHVWLGNVSRGFSTENIRVDVKSKGNTDVLITSIIETEEGLFDNLYYSKRLSGNDYEFKKLDDFSLLISKPSSMGGQRQEYFYVKLDLEDYVGGIPLGANRLDSSVKFIVVSI